MRTLTRLIAPAVLLLAVAACDTDVTFGGPAPGAPEDLTAEYRWVFEGFTSAGQAVGHPTVELNWLPPTDWNDEPFRVYGRRAGDSRFFLIATVTSCTERGCTYRDRNVAPGRSYSYYVATVDEDNDEETSSEFQEEVFVPSATTPAAPRPDSAVALDNAAYLRWTAGGGAGSIARYAVYLTRLDGAASLYNTGEADGTSYLDTRAENGHVYGYRVAAIDTLGHVSALSAEMTVVPRPDRTAELVYAFSANAAQSGFRFVTRDGTAAVVSGTAADAHWRLERDAAGWRMVPLNGTRIFDAGRTTALACGPGAGPECRAVDRAPAAGYVSTAVSVNPESSYVLAVTGSDGRPHFGVVRVSLLGTDQTGRSLMIFDWAYQQVAGEARLDRSAL
jgi:hypothetical protein